MAFLLNGVIRIISVIPSSWDDFVLLPIKSRLATLSLNYLKSTAITKSSLFGKIILFNNALSSLIELALYTNNLDKLGINKQN